MLNCCNISAKINYIHAYFFIKRTVSSQPYPRNFEVSNVDQKWSLAAENRVINMSLKILGNMDHKSQY